MRRATQHCAVLTAEVVRSGAAAHSLGATGEYSASTHRRGSIEITEKDIAPYPTGVLYYRTKLVGMPPSASSLGSPMLA